MNLDWLKSISARIGIEGRNAIIFLSLFFCGFGILIFERGYSQHSILSWAFLSVFVLLAIITVLIGLLAKPRPSEVTEKYLLQLVDKQVLFAGGFQSPYELVDFLRTAHNIQQLPPPSALVEGSASNEADHKEIPRTEADRIVREDQEGVLHMLQREADRILASFRLKQVAEEVKKQIAPPEKVKQVSE